MEKELEQIIMPLWLQNFNPEKDGNVFPLFDILKDSVYYPASNHDGSVIRSLMGNFYSFVYVDYFDICNSEEILNLLYSESQGQKGYKPIFHRIISSEELSPNYANYIEEVHDIKKITTAEEKSKYEFWIKNNENNAFAIWFIMERSDEFDEDHNPKRYSYLFIKGEGVATYQAIYNFNKLKPKLVVIKGSIGFTGNWTQFSNRSLIFAKVVLDLNEAGKPDYIFYCEGHYGGKCCWIEYSNEVFLRWGRHGYYGIWGLNK